MNSFLENIFLEKEKIDLLFFLFNIKNETPALVSCSFYLIFPYCLTLSINLFFSYLISFDKRKSYTRKKEQSCMILCAIYSFDCPLAALNSSIFLLLSLCCFVAAFIRLFILMARMARSQLSRRRGEISTFML